MFLTSKNFNKSQPAPSHACQKQTNFPNLHLYIFRNKPNLHRRSSGKRWPHVLPRSRVSRCYATSPRRWRGRRWTCNWGLSFRSPFCLARESVDGERCSWHAMLLITGSWVAVRVLTHRLVWSEHSKCQATETESKLNSVKYSVLSLLPLKHCILI